MTSPDTSHLVALVSRLTAERGRLDAARSLAERQQRAVWVAGIEREIADERRFLGLPDEPPPDDLSDDDLLAALAG